jgi:hypothetical protein
MSPAFAGKLAAEAATPGEVAARPLPDRPRRPTKRDPERNLSDALRVGASVAARI